MSISRANLTPSEAHTVAPSVTKGIRESTAAAEYWGKFVPVEQRVAFQAQLVQMFVIDFQKHWYEAEPHRGSAFRSIKCDEYGVDSKLMKAMSSVGISLDSATFPQSVVMWVNPGDVKVRYGKSWSPKIIYSDSESPARKMYHPLGLQMEVESTILCSDASEYYDSSEPSSDSSDSFSSRSTPPTSPSSSPSILGNQMTILWKSGQEFVPQMPLAAVPMYA